MRTERGGFRRLRERRPRASPNRKRRTLISRTRRFCCLLPFLEPAPLSLTHYHSSMTLPSVPSDAPLKPCAASVYGSVAVMSFSSGSPARYILRMSG